MGELGNSILDTVSSISQKLQAIKRVLYHPQAVTLLAGYLSVDGRAEGAGANHESARGSGKTVSRDESHPPGFPRNNWKVGHSDIFLLTSLHLRGNLVNALFPNLRTNLHHVPKGSRQ